MLHRKVLLSNQCKTAADHSGMPIVTTDQAQLHDEVGMIDAALTELESALQLYPEDFFILFRNETGEQGVLVLLVEDISYRLNAIGVCYEMDQWYLVAVDITSGEVFSTYCHEIRHATENKINTANADLLSAEKWDACNPERHVYSYNISESYNEGIQYTS